MKRLPKGFRRILKRSQTGQAILLLAFGFITLIGFVGLVVDLSVLYIRYAALRRAVDAAAVAAAGQFSRTISDEENKQRTTFAARQFLEFHGIESDGVVVDSCSSVPNETDTDRNGDGQVVNWNYTDAEIAAAPLEDPGDGSPTQAELTYRRDLFVDVCDPDRVGVGDSNLSGRKLVRVQASIVVPTTFMSFFGQSEFELTASAVSETASLDVVIVMDVSESMLFDTTYDDYDRWLFNAGQPNDTGGRVIRYLPSRLRDSVHAQYRAKNGGSGDSPSELHRSFLENFDVGGLSEIRNNITYDSSDGSTYFGNEPFFYPGPCGGEDPCELNVGYARYFMTNSDTVALLSRGELNVAGDDLDETTGVATGVPYVAPPANRDYYDLRPQCRVAVHPGTFASAGVKDTAPNNLDGTGYGTQKSLLEQYRDLTGGNGGAWSGGRYNMFQPNFDFYGCCNDPSSGSTIQQRTGRIVPYGYRLSDPSNPDSAIVKDSNFSDGDRRAGMNFSDGYGGDFDFSDLVCQPFKQARDASQEFLYNIDFIAGDRVAFVTFDRAAHAIDPDGVGDGDNDGIEHTVMIEDRNVAERVLVQSIGVRAEPNFYHQELVSPEVPTTAGASTKDFANGVFKWRGFTETTDSSTDIDSDGVNDVTTTPLDIAAYDDTKAGVWTQQYLVSGSCAYYNAYLPGDAGSHEGEDFDAVGASLWDDNGKPWGILWDPTQEVFSGVYTSPTGDITRDSIRSRVESIAENSLFYGYHTYELWGNCRGTNIGAALREANDVLVDERWTRRDGAVWVVVLLSDGAAGATDPVVDIEVNPYNRVGGGTYTAVSDPIRGEYGAFGFCPPGTMNTTDEPTTGTEIFSGYALDGEPPHCVDLDPDTRHACATDIDGNVATKSTSNEIELIATQNDNINWGDAGCRSYDPDDYARDWADFVGMERPNELRQLPTIYTIGFNLEYNTPVSEVPGATTLCEANPIDCLGEELLRYIADIGDNNQRDIGDYPSATEDRFVRVNYGNYWNAPDGDELRDVFDEIASRLFVRLTG